MVSKWWGSCAFHPPRPHPTANGPFSRPPIGSRPRSNIILQGTDTLRRTNPILEEEPEALDGGAVSHPLGELGRVGAVHVDDGREAVGVVDVAAHAPAAARRLVLGAREERVQQLGRLRVRRVAQDRARLRPRHERAFGRVRHVVRRAARVATAAGEGGGVRACEEEKNGVLVAVVGLQGEERRMRKAYRWSCRRECQGWRCRAPNAGSA